MIELRDGGNKLIVYTDEPAAYKQLQRLKGYLGRIYYEQNEHYIAVDCYFEKAARRPLSKLIKTRQVQLV